MATLTKDVKKLEEFIEFGSNEGHDERALEVFYDNDWSYNQTCELKEILGYFEESFSGEYDDEAEFSESLILETGVLNVEPEWLIGCIDWQEVWDAYLRFDYWFENGFVFRNV
jgi:hypothetical protein